MPTNMGRVRENGQLMGRVAYGMYWALFKAEFIYLYATPHWLTRVDRKLEKTETRKDRGRKTEIRGLQGLV